MSRGCPLYLKRTKLMSSYLTVTKLMSSAQSSAQFMIIFETKRQARLGMSGGSFEETDGRTFGVVTPDQYRKSDFDNNLQYPPVPPPKVGRPKKAGRIKGGKEKARERKRALPLCSACGKAGHISTNKKCEHYRQRAPRKK